MRIQHNIMAMNAYRNYNNNTSALSKNLEKLSSGYKINRAGDDAAGLAISEKMRAQITGLSKAQDNAKDGISLVQTAEGALTEVHDMLNRMYELAEQSANGTYEDGTDRLQLQKEVTQLKEEINRIADATNFNGINLLDGSLGLNADAFDVSVVDAVKANDNELSIDSFFGKNDGTDMHLGKEGVANETGPSFTIDLGNMSYKLSGTADETLTIDFGGESITITLTSAGGAGAAASGTYNTNDIANALKDAMLATSSGMSVDTDGNTASNEAVKFGDFVLDVDVQGSKVTFSFAGMVDGGKYVEANTASGASNFTEDQADAFNALVGSTVTVSGSNVSGVVYDATMSVTHAEAKTDAKKAGIDLDLSKLVQHEGTLTIGANKYIFKTDRDDKTFDNKYAGSGYTVIDLTSQDGNTAKQIEMAVEYLSKQSFTSSDPTSNKADFVIEAKDSTTLHFEQVLDDDVDLTTRDALIESLEITATGPMQEAKNVGTKITATPGSIQEGDMLTIGDKQYIFTEDTNKTGTDSDSGATYIQMGKGGVDALENLNTQLVADGFTTEYDKDNAPNDLTIYAEDGEYTAPAVLGKGLTLQIGDTSDSYNQLSVTVKDIHTDALGIKDLNVGNQDGAADALDVIKNAINYVSDVRGTLGATQNRLDHTMNNLSVMEENIQDAESTIRDTDVADEMMAYTKNNILIQSAQAMLAQANQVPQGVLQLLQ